MPAMRTTIDALRQAELAGIFQRSGAVFESGEYHYALPYVAMHAAKFVRLVASHF